MDNYRFGNLICSLREEHGLTQKELAKKLDVSDKAVSKWENGQAIPRMETLERIAATLDTTVEEMITLSSENVKRVLIVNEFGTLLHFQIDDEIISLNMGEEKQVLIDSSKSEYKAVVFGEIKLSELFDEEDEEDSKSLKDKLVDRGIKRVSKN